MTIEFAELLNDLIVQFRSTYVSVYTDMSKSVSLSSPIIHRK